MFAVNMTFRSAGFSESGIVKVRRCGMLGTGCYMSEDTLRRVVTSIRCEGVRNGCETSAKRCDTASEIVGNRRGSNGWCSEGGLRA